MSKALQKSAIALAIGLTFSSSAFAQSNMAVINQESSTEDGNNVYVEQGGFLNWAYADQIGNGNDTYLLQLDQLQTAEAYVLSLIHI